MSSKLNTIPDQKYLDRLLEDSIQIGSFHASDSKDVMDCTVYTSKVSGPFIARVHGPIGSFNTASFLLEWFKASRADKSNITVRVRLRGLHSQLKTNESLRSIQEALLLSHRNVFPNE